MTNLKYVTVKLIPFGWSSKLTEIVLKLKGHVRFPVDGSPISPDNFAGKSFEEIEGITLLLGNRERRMDNLFEVSGDPSDLASDQAIKIVGDVRSFREIGKDMSDGLILFTGNAGFNVGEGMKGGKIVVEGDAGSWLGSSMKGGLIEVQGSADNQVGAAYRGGKGMTGGSIVIHGNVGYELASWMEGGFIHVMGNTGQFAGVHMSGGAIAIEGNSEGRLGASMTGGRIVLLGNIPNILPSFSFEEVRSRARAGDNRYEGRFYMFSGDLNEGGSGRIYISALENSHLGFYEKLIEDPSRVIKDL